MEQLSEPVFAELKVRPIEPIEEKMELLERNTNCTKNEGILQENNEK